jgi:hypothetical protein
MRRLLVALCAGTLLVLLLSGRTLGAPASSSRPQGEGELSTPTPSEIEITPPPTVTPLKSFAEPAWTTYRDTRDLGAITLHDAYVAAWDEAQAFGYDLGYALGCCYSEGYEDGHADGQVAGHAAGHTEGYAAGLVAGQATALASLPTAQPTATPLPTATAMPSPTPELTLIPTPTPRLVMTEAAPLGEDVPVVLESLVPGQPFVVWLVTESGALSQTIYGWADAQGEALVRVQPVQEGIHQVQARRLLGDSRFAGDVLASALVAVTAPRPGAATLPTAVPTASLARTMTPEGGGV